jgi:short-subunit dehydrogenase
VEAISDALRFEVAKFGVVVSIVEPGMIRTAFGDGAAESLGRSSTPDGSYAALNAAFEEQMASRYRSPLLSAPPATAAKAIERAVTARRPRTRYLLTPAARALVHARRLLGARAFDAYLRMQFRGA